ncbi:pilus assembly protein [Polaromonas sp. CT11-55]|uniref:pilus assembly protein n=1 Tax=Polaromonas sp. CT11-55 TaxID=3243045 RepID=UPI0039A637A2
MINQLGFFRHANAAPGALRRGNSVGALGAAASHKSISGCVSILRSGLLGLLVLAGAAPWTTAVAQTTVDIAKVPLLALKSAPGLVMMTMSRDQRLYYSAYNDASDLDGDGVLDVGYDESITYYGYFISDRCYKYDTSVTPNRFVPVSIANASTGCSASTGRWHGNWMNWMATSRMDALRKVLYGGKRVTDTASTTVLEAAHIPPDAHIWGKEYRPASVTGTDTYDITKYTPLSAPTSGKMHLFMMKSEGTAGSNSIGVNPPSMRVVLNVDGYIDRAWLWASSERPVGGAAGTSSYTRPSGRLSNPTSSAIGYGLPGFSTGTSYSSQTFPYAYNYIIRVEACVNLSGGVGREAGCTGYPASSPTSWKPTGVLHDYSVNDQLKFGLLTGSYTNNYSGGVVRKDIGSFRDEFSATTGIFNNTGITKTINSLTNYGFDITDQTYYCNGNTFLWNRLRNQGECNMWGAPVAEMMYEGLRYFTDKQPLDAFSSGVDASTSADTRIGLPLVTTWSNPFRPVASGGSPICSRPVQMVIADPVTSFDSDQLPGAKFTPITGLGTAIPTTDLTGLNVETEADAIWTSEFGTATKNFFIGQSTAANADGNPSAKAATTFSYLRGHAPDETNTQGSYYAASVARFGQVTGVKVRPDALTQPTTVKVDNLSIALGTVVPKIEMTYAGKKVSLVPLSKSVAGCSPGPTASFKPTGSIMGFFVDRIANTAASNTDATINGGRPFIRAMVSFSDMDVGGDNEADANAYYTLSINSSGKLVVQIDSYYQATCAEQHLGYVISGTTADGAYLEVTGFNTSTATSFSLDTMTTHNPAPKSASRTFTLSSVATGATYVPHDPLWYAAKYGGSGVLDDNGDPTNYFKVTSPADLPAQMGKAFRSAAALAAVASTSVVGVGQRSLGSAAIYQANYDSLTWSSRIYAFPVATDGTLADTPVWEVSTKIPAPATRNKLFLGRGGTTTPFALIPTGFTSLTAAEQADFGSAAIYSYLLGDKTAEERKGGGFRNRGTTAGADYGSVLGDIVNSDPQIISKKDYDYAASDATYTTFLTSINFETLAVGSNDGFFHIFDAEPDATGGGELLGFMPQAARNKIKDLSDPAYQHRNFVDGPIAIGHAKIAVPGDATVNWRTVVVGTGGDGVQTVFAVNATSKTFTANSILWEINQSSTGVGTTLGNVMGRPAIGKLNDGTWVAIFGNGYNSTAGTANLYVVSLDTGAIIRIIPTNASFTGNGLGSIEIVRKTTGNRDTIDYVYGADFKGNIWRFDPNVATAAALIYSTPTGRPITAEIKVGPAPTSALTTGGKMIYFGTGSYLAATDPANTTVQALYGIFDSLGTTSSSTPFATEASLSSMTITAAAGADTRTTSAADSPAWYTVAGKKGWVVPLTGTNVVAGERVIAPPVRYTVGGLIDAFLFTSIVPSTDECQAGLDAWITGVDAMTGGYKKVFSTLLPNSVRIRGGSPRGVFVLQDGGAPTLYISQTIFNGQIEGTSFTTGTGGTQTVNINGVAGTTRVISIGLTNPTAPASASRQVWRQLK